MKKNELQSVSFDWHSIGTQSIESCSIGTRSIESRISAKN